MFSRFITSISNHEFYDWKFSLRVWVSLIIHHWGEQWRVSTVITEIQRYNESCRDRSCSVLSTITLPGCQEHLCCFVIRADFCLNDVKFEVELLDLKNCFVVHQIFSCAWHLETTQKKALVFASALCAFVLNGFIFNAHSKIKLLTISLHACSRPDACKVGAE